MDTPLVTPLVREARTAIGISQAELAARVGVSRQTLNAIELGRQIPSTAVALQLARALRCAVDDLFRLAGGATTSARLASPTSNPRRLVLGRVDGALVAHPCEAAERAADGLLIERVSGREEALVEPLAEATEIDANLLVAGCAPLLGMLSERLTRRHRSARATWVHADSGRALQLLEQRLVHVAGVHLTHQADPDAHVRLSRAALPEQRVTIVNLARWRQGLVVAPGNPRGIRPGVELLRADLRRAQRAPGAGASHVLARAACIAAPPPLAPGDLLVRDHAEVVRAIRWGIADVGVAIEPAALAEGLTFIPLSEERFDLLIPEARLSAPPVRRLLDLIDRPSFRAEAARLPGYDLSQAGQASTISAAQE